MWRAGEDEIQSDEHCATESMPVWNQYLVYVDMAKARAEIPKSFEEWKEQIKFEQEQKASGQ